MTSNGSGPCNTSAVEMQFANSRYHWSRFFGTLGVRTLDGVSRRAGESAATSREEVGKVGNLIPVDSAFLDC